MRVSILFAYIYCHILSFIYRKIIILFLEKNDLGIFFYILQRIRMGLIEDLKFTLIILIQIA